MPTNQCKTCRQQGQKLFLKGDRCFSAKCVFVKRAYPPGPKGKRRRKQLSEYGRELREKQGLKKWYNLGEQQFKNYVKEILQKRGQNQKDPAVLLVQVLEKRLDNIVFRLGFAKSRAQARQMVSHGYFSVNGKPTKIPSYQLRKNDTLQVRTKKTEKIMLQNLKPLLKKQKTPSWLELDAEKMEAKVIGEPNLEEAAPPAEIPTIFEFYSR
ncbi:MAG: 30S ribosomal protein S4 [Candidatus Nealsonbacteria bacterium RIFCSPLOWO2_01_FULL_41_9]|uniref:Small ribosomal subunit protein uS4 n=1 Tax=Candidatus Nealsonbacteria bacterium RIFCSPLOWO2_01_FULL_41_9 TaxID=1801671 RepID=A0A1G2EFI2_9BACT|nr:MAG: 30S ribosomal protein S4 [Candidatus Nealsonbacteria bacterium RIFCSPLOWO2_01_FULL_41_9]